MIDQLKTQLQARVDDLSPAQAEQAAHAAVDFLKDRLPAPIAGRLEELVDGDGEGDLDGEQLSNTIKGFLGG